MQQNEDLTYNKPRAAYRRLWLKYRFRSAKAASRVHIASNQLDARGRVSHRTDCRLNVCALASSQHHRVLRAACARRNSLAPAVRWGFLLLDGASDRCCTRMQRVVVAVVFVLSRVRISHTPPPPPPPPPPLLFVCRADSRQHFFILCIHASHCESGDSQERVGHLAENTGGLRDRVHRPTVLNFGERAHCSGCCFRGGVWSGVLGWRWLMLFGGKPSSGR